MNSKRSWFVFGVAALAYIAAVLQRSSLGVSGVSAADRYYTSAAILSTLAVVQLIVYAALQIPNGILIDRVGPKLLIVVGTAVMVVGQLTLAFSTDIGIAVIGRVLVGAGDSAIFISVIRLVNSWFSGRIVPQLSQWMGNLGAIGQILSAVPFAIVLHEAGWSAAFTSAASVALLAFILSLLVLGDRPPSVTAPEQPTLGVVLKRLGPTLRRPGTQLGFWSHFVTQSSGTVFALFWGFPFMVSALGYSTTLASGLLVVIVVVGLVSGPILGLLTARFPTRRSNLVLGIVAMLGVVWTAVLVWPGTPPLWLVVLLVVAMGAGGPGSLIGFDFARTFNPPHTLGSANGVVNVGGFTASFVMLFLIGVILDALHNVGFSASLYDVGAFKLAFAVQYVVIGLGVLFLVRARRRARAQLEEDEGISVAPLWVALSAAWSRKRP
ncbi:MFS transporter [Subtercola boreus]|uniref:MFS transporter n=1 Tax=Subtercola boreus TaxID=120213 RepID=A0A3E0WC09_9MICO|nr:MFS transporter [Subtercola boreus]RFA20765.1 MFS transporter [Subtercola boreus]RFA20880.1 MFS transporter [Subtercola boreus]RFA27073.1 MFS transporter [Subtercola boreus]